MRESPGLSTGASAAPVEAVDLATLRAQTGGDANLEREVLGLYLRHCPDDLARLKAAGTAEARRQIAHRMAGSARAVGAAGVARLAAAVEKGDAAALPALEAAVAEATGFITRHLAG